MRSRVAMVLCGAVVVLVATLGPAVDVAAQDEPSDVSEFDGTRTEDDVNVIVIALVAIAAGTAVMMLAFLWHTSPRRRLTMAQRRAARATGVNGRADGIDSSPIDGADGIDSSPIDGADSDRAER